MKSIVSRSAFSGLLGAFITGFLPDGIVPLRLLYAHPGITASAAIDAVTQSSPPGSAPVDASAPRWRAQYDRAVEQAAWGNWGSAARASREAIGLGCLEVSCFTLLGRSAWHEGRPPEMERFFGHACVRDKPGGRLRTGLCQVGLATFLESSMSRTADALEAWNHATLYLSGTPQYADAAANRATFLVRLGREPDAIPQLEALLADLPPDAAPMSRGILSWRLGDALVSQGRARDGKLQLERARELVAPSANSEWRLRIDIRLGEALAGLADYAGAESLCTAALQQAEARRDLEVQAGAGICLARLSLLMGRPERTAALADRVCAIAEKTGDRRSCLEARSPLVLAHAWRRDFNRSRELAGALRALVEGSQEQGLLWRLDYYEGAAESFIGVPEAAVQRFLSGLQRCEQRQDRQCQALLLASQAVLAGRREGSSVPIGAVAYQRALVMAEELGDLEVAARCHRGLCTQLAQVDPAGGATHCEAGITLSAEIGDRRGLAEAYMKRGVYSIETGQLEEALEDHYSALAIARQPGVDHFVLAWTVAGNLAGLLSDLGRPAEAITLLNGILPDVPTANRRKRGNMLSNLGYAYLSLRQYPEARDALSQAVQLLSPELELDLLMYVEDGLSQVELESGALLEAYRHAQRAVALAGSIAGPWHGGEQLHLLARVEAKIGRLEDAHRHIDQSMDMLLGNMLQMPDLEQRSAFFAAHSSGMALKIDLELRSSPAAAAVLARTFVLGEDARSRSFHLRLLPNAANPLSTAPEPLVSQWKAAGTWVNRIQSFIMAGEPSRIEREAMIEWIAKDSSAGARARRGDPERSLEDTKRLTDMLSALRSGDIPAQDRRELLEMIRRSAVEARAVADAALLQASPGLRSLFHPATVSLDDLRSELDDHTVVLAYLLGEDTSFLWVVTKDSARIHRLRSEREIAAVVQALRSDLMTSESSNSDLRPSARALYDEVIAPAGDLIRSGDHLVIVPDGCLANIPFEALMGPDSPVKAGVEPWLGLDHPISYAPSATVWWRLKRRGPGERADGPMLLVADPAYLPGRSEDELVVEALGRGDAGFPRLKHAQEEAVAIERSRMKPWHRSRKDIVLTGIDATEEAVWSQPLEQFSILHFATHAEAFTDQPELSCLLLAPEQPATWSDGEGPSTSDGRISLPEITSARRLNADLVVLSACETAEGRTRRGEIVESLARGFLLAGARAVVASQWKVNDRSTSRFMGTFYRELRRRSIADALFYARRAFILGSRRTTGPVAAPRGPRLLRHLIPDLRESLSGVGNDGWSRPYFWAPFILLEGDGTLPETER